MSKKKEIISLIIGFVGAVAGLYSVVSFNRFVLMSLPIGIRMVCMILTYWLIALIPTIVMIVNKDKLTDYGFSKEKIGMQIIVGILIGTEMSVLLTLIPHLIGFGEFVDSGKDINTYGNSFMNSFIVYLQLALLKSLYSEDSFLKKSNVLLVRIS